MNLNNIEMCKSYLNEAKLRLKTAITAFRDGEYAYCIRQCQEAVELSLKAALRLVGIEPPNWHDVGPVLREERERFPQWF